MMCGEQFFLWCRDSSVKQETRADPEGQPDTDDSGDCDSSEPWTRAGVWLLVLVWGTRLWGLGVFRWGVVENCEHVDLFDE